jgi:putative heme transporter
VPPPLEWAAAMAWRLLLVAIVAYLAARLLARLRLVVVPMLAALLLTSLLGPPVEWLRRRGWPSLAATWTVLAAALLVLAGVLFLVTSRVVPQLGDLTVHLGDSLDRIRGWLVHGPLHLSDRQLGDLTRRLEQELAAHRAAIVSRVVSTTALLLELAGGAILTFLLTFFLLKDGPWMEAWLLERIGEPLAGRLRPAGRAAWATLSGYLHGVAIVGLFDAAFIGIGLLLLGVPLVLSLALLTFVGAFLPLVGAFGAGLLSALVALVSRGPLTAVAVVGLTLAVQQFEGHVLQPVVMSRAVRLHPVVILMVLGAGGILGGIVGAFLAVPVVAITTSAVTAWRSAAASGGGDD